MVQSKIKIFPQIKSMFYYFFDLTTKSKRFIVVAGLITLITVVLYLRSINYLTVENIISFSRLHHTLAPTLYILFYALMVVTLIPTLPLNLGAGFLWGPFWGGVISIIGASLGALAPFLIARYVARDYLRRKFKSNAWQLLLREIKQKNWKIVAFTRVNPVFPFGILSYFFGLTPISFKRYSLATIASIVPGVFVFATIGDVIGDIVLKGRLYDIFQALGAIAFLLTTIVIAIFAMRKYWKISNIKEPTLEEEIRDDRDQP